MGLLELLLIGTGLSMDAFAVSVCKGLNMREMKKFHCFLIGLFFGYFQALMPLIGWILGKQFEHYITFIDHWISFVLLAIIGGKMIYEAIKGNDVQVNKIEEKLDVGELLILSIATSIDALAVGVTFAFLQVKIVPAINIIGITTFLLSMVGVYIGNIFGSKYKSKAELVGGIILVTIGLKILFEHLGIF
ncbi:manganese efflux pump MntP family protein [Lachnospiraceae bacterium ZAX-1]